MSKEDLFRFHLRTDQKSIVDGWSIDSEEDDVDARFCILTAYSCEISESDSELRPQLISSLKDLALKSELPIFRSGCVHALRDMGENEAARKLAEEFRANPKEGWEEKYYKDMLELYDW